MKSLWLSFCAMLIGAVMIFYIFQKTYTNLLFDLALQPKVQEVLAAAMEDQRQLSQLNPASTALYRNRFNEIKQLRDNYAILEHSREDMVTAFQVVLTTLLVGILVASAAFYYVQHRRQARRLENLQKNLVALSEGQTDLQIEDHGRDMLGHFARMIEKASGVLAKQRQRLANLESLSAWQEAARRHAHEIRTPLTAARMELSALLRFISKQAPDLSEQARTYEASVNEELDRLKEFTQSFTSFAKIGKPQRQLVDLRQMLDQFAATFAEAWPNLQLHVAETPPGIQASLDKEMVRQVLVNLCNNSALAVQGDVGTVRFQVGRHRDTLWIDVTDNGPGIPPDLRANLFKPYTTSRKIGEGMGLGLSIAKKILLDHGGDLELFSSSPEGVCFRLTFPENMEPEPDA